MKGYLIKKDDKWFDKWFDNGTGKESIIADGILSEVLSTRQTQVGIIRKVRNHGETKQSCLLEVDGVFAHGKTLKEAKKSWTGYAKSILTKEAKKSFNKFVWGWNGEYPVIKSQDEKFMVIFEKKSHEFIPDTTFARQVRESAEWEKFKE